MKKVVVGSNNPVKLNATKEAFAAMFPDEKFEFQTFSAKSGVPDQPIGLDETKEGARNRALGCKSESPDADFCVGLEGGLEIINEQYWVSAWMCIIDKSGTEGYGRTGSFLLPPRVKELIDGGMELGHATDAVFNEENSKQKGGAVGVLTNDTVTRTDFYREAMIFALIPFSKPELYL